MREKPVHDRDPWVDEDGVLRIQFGSRPRSVDDAERTMRLAEAAAAGRLLPMLIDARALSEMPPPGSWLRSIRWMPSVASAVATVVSEESPDRIMRFQHSVDALLVPARVFGDTDEAITWLLEVTRT